MLLHVKVIKILARLAVDPLILKHMGSYAVGMRHRLAPTRFDHLRRNPKFGKVARLV